MGVMNKLRDNAGAILILLVFSFVVIWGLNDVGLFDVQGAQAAGNMIVVDGEGISTEDYNNAVRGVQEQIQQQNPNATPQQLDGADEQAFEALVEDRLVKHEMDRLGLTVTDDEVRAMINGPTPHPIVTQSFPDGQGGLNRAALQQFIDDPANAERLIQLEDYIRVQRRQEKFQRLIESTAHVSDAEVADAFTRTRRTVTADVVALRYSTISDDSARVTDADVEAYYNANREDYARKKTWAVSLVSASKDPSREDTAVVRTELDRIRPRFLAATDDSSFLAREGSERPYSGAYFKPGDLEGAITRAIFPNPQVGRLYGPIVSGNEAILVKVKAVRPAGSEFVHARHILLQAAEGDSAARGAARARLNQIKAQVASGASFEALAKANSQDGSAAEGGDLGWFGTGAMVKPFEDAAFAAAPGSVVGPVETQFGLHLIQTIEKANQEVQVATYATRLQAESGTLQAAEDKLEDFRYNVEQDGPGAMQADAGRLGLPFETHEYADEQSVYPGVGQSSTATRFLKTAKAGDVSDVIELDNKFVVLVVTAVTPEGFRPLADVREEARAQAAADRKKEVATRRLRRALAQGGFNGLAARTQGVQVGATLAGGNVEVTGYGPQPRLAGTLSVAAQGATTPIVAGDEAAFVARVTAAPVAGAVPPAERDALRTSLLQRKRALIRGRFIQALREKAEIEDNRARFDQ